MDIKIGIGDYVTYMGKGYEVINIKEEFDELNCSFEICPVSNTNACQCCKPCKAFYVKGSQLEELKWKGMVK